MKHTSTKSNGLSNDKDLTHASVMKQAFDKAKEKAKKEKDKLETV